MYAKIARTARTLRSSSRHPESTSGYDINELPSFQNGINFMAPQTDLPAVWDSYQNVVRNSREKGLTNGITITSHYEDRQGERYETAWTINPLLLEGSGYSDYKGYEDEVQALQDQARASRRSLTTSENQRID